MGTKQREDADDGALKVLEERLESSPDDHDDIWEAFTERDDESDVLYRSNSVEDTSSDPSSAAESSTNGGHSSALMADDLPDPSDSPAHLDHTETDDGLLEELAPDATGRSGDSVQDDPLDELIDRDDERLQPDDDVRRVQDDAQEFVVPKGDYCEQCPHYSDPPDVGCTNKNTEILEFEDLDHVRVRNCPVVNDNPLTPDQG